MKVPTHQELMTAHNIARNSADAADAKAKATNTVVKGVDPNRKLEQFPQEHPFGGNDNNRRVAERIVREARINKFVAPAATALAPHEAALADLQLADELDSKDEPELTDEEMEARDDAATAATLAAKQSPAGSQPTAPDGVPAWKGNA